MKWTEYSERFKAELTKSSEQQMMELAIEICAKLLPDYHEFFEETSWGDATTISKAYELIKNSANGRPTRTESINEIISEVEKNIPDTEDFGQISASLALNSSLAILETLNFILDKKPDRISDIGTLSYDSVYFKVGELKPKLSELEIENHVDLQNEIKWQLEKIKHVA